MAAIAERSNPAVRGMLRMPHRFLVAFGLRLVLEIEHFGWLPCVTVHCDSTGGRRRIEKPHNVTTNLAQRQSPHGLPSAGQVGFDVAVIEKVTGQLYLIA